MVEDNEDNKESIGSKLLNAYGHSKSRHFEGETKGNQLKKKQMWNEKKKKRAISKDIKGFEEVSQKD